MFKNFICNLKHEFSGYNKEKFVKDLFAGLTVSAVALPLALAFGISSGADAAAGLITAIIAGFIIGFLSGGSFQISGPTGAMTAILIPLALKFKLQGVFVVCLISGFILIICGLLKLGRFVSCIPSPVIIGFTSGISVIIILGQLDNFFGVTSVGADQLERTLSYFHHNFSPNLLAVILGVLVIAFMIFYPKKLNQKFPSSLAAIILAVIVNYIFKLPVAVIGNIPKTLILENRLNFLSIDFSNIGQLILPAISVAALGMIESLLCGACGKNLKNDVFDPNQELIAQGIGNIIIPFFGGVPATAAIARTSVAIKSGCVTRVTSIVHSVGILASIFLLGGIMSNIPLCALSGILIVTSFRMNEWEKIKEIFSGKFKSSIAQFLLTMISTIVFDLTIAIIIGIIIGILAFMSHISNLSIDSVVIDPQRINIEEKELKDAHSNSIVVYLTGPIFFMTIEKLSQELLKIQNHDIIIFSMRGVPLVDVTAAETIYNFCNNFITKGKKIAFCGVNENVMKVFKKTEIADALGESSFYWSADKAILNISKKRIDCTLSPSN